MLRRTALSLLLAACVAAPAGAGTGFDIDDAPPSVVLTGPTFTLAGSSISSFGETPSRRAKKPKKRKSRLNADSTAVPDAAIFSAQRASILLRSLTVPGWGQATLGKRHAAAFFGTAELGIWTAFTAFRIQEVMRAQSYTRTARLFAGIDLSGRDEEYRRIVGAFSSSDEYNLLVVARDAANLYMPDPYAPDMAGYRAYIAQHSLSGANAWQWADEQSFRRYGSQRKDAQRAAIRANTAMAVAIANRIVSAVHAARGAGKAAAGAGHTSWNVDFRPGQPGERVLFRSGLTARF
jgi:hypothetical protein